MEAMILIRETAQPVWKQDEQKTQPPGQSCHVGCWPARLLNISICSITVALCEGLLQPSTRYQPTIEDPLPSCSKIYVKLIGVVKIETNQEPLQTTVISLLLICSPIFGMIGMIIYRQVNIFTNAESFNLFTTDRCFSTSKIGQ